MGLRSSSLALGALLLAGFVAVGCADGNTPPARRDAMSTMDGGDGAVDAGPRDVGTDTARDAIAFDGGRGSAGQCEACVADADCRPDMYCAPVTGGRACFPVCNFEMPVCARGFQCVEDHSSTPAPVCAPVGERCCVDADGDGYGVGIGCLGTDCNDDATTGSQIHPGAAETCDGVDQNCDGSTDEGDPAMLCTHPAHVATTACMTGSCRIATCEPGFGNCNSDGGDGCETDISTATDCGACGTPCALPHSTTPMCNHGTCAIGVCDPGFGDCDGNPLNGCETSLDSATHCGSCTGTCGLPNSTSSCSTGTCLVGTCDRNWGDCDGRSMNGCETPLVTNTDCGTCGSVCAPGAGTGTCTTGTCRVTTCAAGFDDCDMVSSNGCETNVRTLSNCGACGVPCTFPNGTATCATGACTLSDCSLGFGNCDGITSNGCETRTNTLASCGGCGVICAPPNAAGTCGTGACAISACNAGFADCDGIVSNGCETSTRTLSNCGACGTVCSRPGAAPDCSTGTCQIGMCLATTGNCDGMDDNGCETPIRTLTDCGGCAVTCMRSNAMPTCASGSCSISTCISGYSNCDGVDANGCETSLSTLASCGACGTVCARANATSDCSAGTCHIAACAGGWGNCDGVDANGCETPLTTLSNCGTCGTSCSATNASVTCSTGSCEIVSCSAAYADCDGSIGNGCERSIRTLTDCGGCDLTCSFPNGSATCSSGTCTLAGCSAGFGNCDGNAANGCESPLNTLTNCASCGTTCSFSNGAASCSTGTCALSSCTGTNGNCDGIAANGCETSLRTLSDCGTCGNACSFANAAASCSSGGACTLGTCNPGFANCDGIASNGCETSLTTLTDCASCGTACSLGHATASCASGTCSLTSCSGGFGNCDGSPGNGCETQLNTLANCSGCGTACNLANATSTCGTGTCAISSCNTGFANCDGIVSNGCETSTRTLTDCNACGVACTVMSGTPSCATGTCTVSSCTAGHADCDGNSGNGCETLTNTLTNCGSCGTACSLPNATATCGTGSCAISSCMAGFGNCDGNAANGCETPLNSLTNCAMCGMSCMLPNAGSTCMAGSCMLTGCQALYGNCDGLPANGCETQLTSLTNCGVCGTGCSLAHATSTCTTGSCAIQSCTAGWGNCDGVASNGCETQLNSLSNCGSCGASCSRPNAIATCGSGSCQIGACNAGSGNCDGTDSNGCETALTSTVNCGTCGNPCSPVHGIGTCSTGGCQIGSCNASFYDVDGLVGDGCECADDLNGSSCATATSLGNVASLASATATGVIPTAGGSDWFSATFNTAGVGTPTMAFLSNPSSAFRFDVFVGTCTTGSSCGGAEAATGLTSWDFTDTFVGAPRSVAWPTTVYIRVTRISAGLSCSSYSLRLTRP